MFDLGGAVGMQFYGYQKYVSFPKGVIWTVCEVPPVAELGRKFARQNNAQGLIFESSFENANGAEVMLVSSCLHYLEIPLWQSLSKLASKPRHLLINRAPLCQGTSFATLQNIGRAICVNQIWNRGEFIERFEDVGYALTDSWEAPEFSCYIPFHPERSIRAYSGMYFRAKS